MNMNKWKIKEDDNHKDFFRYMKYNIAVTGAGWCCDDVNTITAKMAAERQPARHTD